MCSKRPAEPLTLNPSPTGGEGIGMTPLPRRGREGRGEGERLLYRSGEKAAGISSLFS